MKRYYEVMLVLCGLLCLPGCANNNRLSMEKSAAEHNEEKSFESGSLLLFAFKNLTFVIF